MAAHPSVLKAPHMPHLDLPTHRLHYRIDGEQGDKPWLTFCNSLGTDLHMWDAQVDELSQDFRILRYDRRGHGLSSAPPAPFTMADLGGDVLALLDALQIERTHFCGLSIGGLTGQWLAIHHGARLDRLALCATAARIGTPDGWHMRMADVKANGLAGLVDATRQRWFTPQFCLDKAEVVDGILAQFRSSSVTGYIGCCAALAAADYRAQLARIACPTLLISGNDDPVCPPSDLEDIAGGAQYASHISLPGRHIVNVEAASQFNKHLWLFLSGGHR